MILGRKERPQYLASIGGVAGSSLGGLATFGISIVASLIGGLLGLFFGGGGPSMADLNKLRDDVSHALDQTYRFAWKSLFAFGGLLKAVDSLWSLVKNIGVKLLQLATRLFDLVTKALVPMLKALHRIREILNQIYDKFLRPVLAVIQHVRRYLQILRLFHVPFADKLDGILARIQGKIVGPYLWVLRSLNGYGRWINVLITAKGTLQRPLFLNSMYRDQGAMVTMFWNSQTSTMRGGPPTVARVPVSQPDSSQVADSFRDLAANDGGPLALPAGVGESTFRAMLSL